MDNRTLRSGGTAMATPTSSDTYGGRIIGTIGSDIRAGVDYEHNTKNAEQTMGGTLNTYLWPDVETEKLGLFFGKDMNNISYGFRYDQVELDPKKANVDTGGGMMQRSANQVYAIAANGGYASATKESLAISGFLRFNNIMNGSSYLSLRHRKSARCYRAF